MGFLSLKPPEGEEISIREGDILGRAETGMTKLRAHPSVSRKHAQFIFDEGQWFVMDLGSSNGTFLEGKKLPTYDPVPLKNGQQLSFSNSFTVTVMIAD